MDIKILPLHLYIQKFHETPRPGCRYEAEDGRVYRVRDGESEDLGDLPETVTAATLPAIGFDGGQFVGDPATVARLQKLVTRLYRLIDEVHEALRA